MNCQEALELLYDYIDREATDLDSSEIQGHLDKCRHCFERFRLEGSVQALIDERSNGLKNTPKLDHLQSNILAKLDSIDAEGVECSDGTIPFLKPSRMIVLAASLILVIAAAFIASDFYRHHDRYSPLEQAHRNAAEQSESFRDEARTTALIDGLASNENYTLNRSVGSFELSGGNGIELLGTNMAHFAYSDGHQFVSVFVISAASYSIPGDLEGTSLRQAGMTFFDHNCRGCRLVFHRVGNVIVITASNDHSVDLAEFVPGKSSI